MNKNILDNEKIVNVKDLAYAYGLMVFKNYN